jgi:hypothetical protein
MKISLIIMLVTCINICSAQIFVDTEKQYKFEVGFEPGGGGIFGKDRITFDKFYAFTLELNSFLGYFPFKNTNLSFGLNSYYNFMKSDIIPSLPPVYGVGPYIKYIYPKTFKFKFFKKISFFSEVIYRRNNFVMNDEIPVYETDYLTLSFPEKNTNLNYSSILLNNGLIIDLGKNFNFNFYGHYMYFFEGSQKFFPRFSFSYMLRNKTEEEILKEQERKIRKEEKGIEKKIKKDEPNTHFLNHFTAGTSLTYIWNSNSDDYPEGENFYEEYTWNVNFAVSLNKRFNLGIQLMNLFTKGTHVEDEHYMIYGLFTQFDFLPEKRTNLFLETSFSRGDYGTCGHLDPYRINNLWYNGLGGGIEFPVRTISENLFIDLSFMNYIILNKIQTKYNYTQYIVGLNYHFGK